MVTSRQFVRGLGRTMRAIDREAKRSEQRRIAYEKAAQKLSLLEAAADAAAEYDAMIAQLVGAHRVDFQPRDWSQEAAEDLQDLPLKSAFHEEQARLALSSYRPGWLAKMIGFAKAERRRLTRNIATGVQADADAHLEVCSCVEKANARIELARGVISLSREAIVQAITNFSQLGGLPFSVEGIDLLFLDDGRIIAMVDGLDLDDMPTQTVTLLQSGKASVKALSPARVGELHRDNICSSAIRVAVELLQVIPAKAVEVVMKADLLDPATGHIHEQPVLHVLVSAQAIQGLNLERAEPAAVVGRLGGTMRWSKRDAFSSIDLDALDVPTDIEIEGA